MNATPHKLLYRVQANQLHAHTFDVSLTVTVPAAQQVVSLPVWIAGSYLVREFARHLSGLRAQQGGQPVAVRQLDKCTWQVDCAPDQPLTLCWQVYAWDASVRTAWLSPERGFFNGTSLCLRVHGQEQHPHHLHLDRPATCPTWQVATGLQAVETTPDGFGLYAAADYDELVDCPVEMGDFWQGQFEARGITHRFVVAGAWPSMDGARLLADAQAICEAQIDFWHGGPAPTPALASSPDAAPANGLATTLHGNYLFMLNAVADGYGGLEHRNSTALICKRADLPRQGDAMASEGYTTLLGLISHEYFHTWNVKRLRPDAFARYDHTQENYTSLLWFFEGFTSYYDDLLLLRAGRIDTATYLRLLGQTLSQVLHTPGRHVHSVAQASFEAWTKYYRTDENTPNATVSYYTKGALVGLCLDLSLRQSGHTLDAVMRGLWQRCHAGPMREQDLLDELQAQTGRSWQAEIGAWAHGTDELPVVDLLAAHGVTCSHTAPSVAQRLGLRASDGAGGIRISHVLRGGAAEAAGLAAGDEWLGVDIPAAQACEQARSNRVASTSWRVRSLDDLPALLGADLPHHPAPILTALVARDQRLLRLPLAWPTPAPTGMATLSVLAAPHPQAWPLG